MTSSNPLLHIDERIPFEQIRPEHVEPAIVELIERCESAFAELLSARADDATAWLRALDRFDEPLDRAATIVSHLESVVTTPELRAAWETCVPRISQFQSRISLDPRLWERVHTLNDNETVVARLESVWRRFLTLTVRDLRRAGAALPDDGKQRVAEIDQKLAELTTTFSQHAIDARAAQHWDITDESELAGLPPTALAAALDAARRAGVEGARLTLDAPIYIAVMTYAERRELRETLWRAQSRLAADAPWDNRPLIESIVALRQEKARLLGYRHFADYVTEERMAGNGERVRTFLTNLEARTRPAFERELNELRAFAAELGCTDLQPWDIAWYSEKLRQRRYDFDAEALRPWFSLDQVLQGMFAIVERVFGVRVEEVPADAPDFPEVWHRDVRFFRVFDLDREVGAFYADVFPRPDKRGGAWMNAFITGGPEPDGRVSPHVGLLCANITPPAGDQPALLTHREVETLFHEFGHLLHHLLSRVPVHSLAGTNVPWDFVELPSQLMENWTWQKPALALFARHWETGEPLPDALLEPMLRARTFQAGTQMMRQLSFGTMDYWLHTEYRPGQDDLLDGCRRIQQRFSAAPLPDDYAMVCSFTHLFAGPVAYAAGYYSYKWAEVLDADVFSGFEKHGIFDRTFGRAYVDTILARGNSADPMDLYVELMGREPDPDALLRRDGLLPVG